MTFQQFDHQRSSKFKKIMKMKPGSEAQFKALTDYIDLLEKQIMPSLWVPAVMAEVFGFYSGRECLVFGRAEDAEPEDPMEAFQGHWCEVDKAFIISNTDVKILDPQFLLWVLNPEEVIRS